MPVIQITYDLPVHIAAGLATGELSLLRTAAVRNSTNITAHIREVSRTVSDGDGPVGASLAKTLKDPKVLMFGLGVVVVGVTAGWIAGRKSQGTTESAVPKGVDAFNRSLTMYLEAVGRGSVSADVVDSLLGALDAFTAEADQGKIVVEMSTEQWGALVGAVADYTRKLADANSFDLRDLEVAEAESGTDDVVDLRRYLEAQRQIIDESA